METPAIYGSDQTEIRPECLRPFSEGWQQPTPAEVRTVLKLAGLTGSETARLVGISDGRTVRRWTGGDAPIPFAAWALLCEAAGLGTIWRRVYLPKTMPDGRVVSLGYHLHPSGDIGVTQPDGSIKRTAHRGIVDDDDISTESGSDIR